MTDKTQDTFHFPRKTITISRQFWQTSTSFKIFLTLTSIHRLKLNSLESNTSLVTFLPDSPSNILILVLFPEPWIFSSLNTYLYYNCSFHFFSRYLTGTKKMGTCLENHTITWVSQLNYTMFTMVSCSQAIIISWGGGI